MVDKKTDTPTQDAETENDVQTETTTEVQTLGLTDDDLRSIESIHDVAGLFDNAPVNVSEVLGNGFTLLDSDDKFKLQDVPFVIVKSQTFMSERHKRLFTTLHLVTESGGKFIINDGSTGIHAQIQQLEKAMPNGGYLPLMVPHGLRLSEYKTIVDGEEKAATTYYLDTSK